VTSIARDGTLEGPDLALYARLRSLTRHPLIASGGIRNVADIRALGAAGVEAAVVGKALYENDLAVGDAIGAAS
jgi:phosphoribosylformimino-5-aminoimidazole carboxamide ribonucleotide (ProFAR) isomerase